MLARTVVVRGERGACVVVVEVETFLCVVSELCPEIAPVLRGSGEMFPGVVSREKSFAPMWLCWENGKFTLSLCGLFFVRLENQMLMVIYETFDPG